MADYKNTRNTNPVTVIVRRTIKKGREADFEQWVKDTTKDLATFPGYMDITIIRPSRQTVPNKQQGNEYVLIIRFDSYKNVDNWEKSEVRNKWMERAKDFTQTVSNQKVTGLEYWFPLPEIPKALVPKRYKMATVTILAIYPLSLIVNSFLSLFPLHLPNLLRGLVVSTVLVLSMTYFVMPFMTSIFRGWLFQQKK